MSKTKFWLIQILMVAIVSLVFGSPVFAGPPDSKGKGAEMSYKALTNHASGSGNVQALNKANGNAAFMDASEEPPVIEEPPADEEPVCSSGTPEGCDMNSCASNGGLWEFFGPGTGCAFAN
jgi:hypothetical protein